MEGEGYSAVPASEPAPQTAQPLAPVAAPATGGIEMTSLSGPTSERLSLTNQPGQGPPKAKVEVKEIPLTPYEQRMAKAKAFVEAIAEHPLFVLLMALYTIWALYNDDIRLAASNKNADQAYEIVISVGFFLFIFEIFATSFYKPEYINLPNLKRGENESLYQYVTRVAQFGSFYFWLDWIATLSLILEVSCCHVGIPFS